jgi:hypothetical protein
MSQWLALDFDCPEHGAFESLWDKRDGDPISEPCPDCGAASPKVTAYAVRGRMKLGEVTQGKNDTALPPHIMSTEALADGMPMAEWKAGRKKERIERRHTWAKKQVS